MKKLIFVLAFLVPSLGSAGSGFDQGNRFVTSNLEGEVSVTCRDGRQQDFAAFRCYMNILDPSEFAYFRGPKNTDADKVFLKATREDGTVFEKNGRYDSVNGISKSRFNLWIETLLQRPLLKLGKNEVKYRLTKGDAVVSKGRFLAEVTQGPDRVCSRRRHYFSSDMNDCRNGNSVCDQYFRDENYCQ